MSLAVRQSRKSFRGSAGDMLAARIDEPPGGRPRAWALFAHCFTCSKDLKAARTISEALAREGFGVLRFDFTGLGESEGEFADTNFSSNLDDLVAAADFMRAELSAPRLLVGHSLGGAAVLAAAGRIPESRAVATIGAPSDTGHLAGRLASMAPELEVRGEAELRLAGRPFTIRRQLLDDLAAHCSAEAIRDLSRALLVLHSPVDEAVGIEHAGRIYSAARHPKSFVSLDDADHLLLRRAEDARYAARVLAAWASRYVGDDTAEPGDAEREGRAHPGVVHVSGRGDRLVQRVSAGGHALVADEPASLGGSDLGPTPYDLLLAALGACTSMTLQMYARRKSWPLDAVDVELAHERIHAKDCEECESREGRVDVIERSIALEGELDDDQRTRLLEIADRCPVHRTLTSELRIRTRAAGES